MPMTLDTYSNCSFNCRYCFSAFQRALGKAGIARAANQFKSVDVGKIERMFRDPDKYAGQFAWYIKARHVVQWGGLSDAFDHCERKFRKSLALLRVFRELRYPVSISTKGVWFLDDPEYVMLLKGADHFHFKISIITPDAVAASKIETGVASPQERFDTLRRLKDIGVGCTTLRYRPFVPFLSGPGIERMIQSAANAQCDSVTTEFLCVERRMKPEVRRQFDVMSQFAGVDLLDFYVKNSPGMSGLLRLNYEYKRPFIDRMVAACARLNLRFFCSDAHHSEKGASAACCGLPDDGPLGNWYKGHFKQALQLAKSNGTVRWTDIAAAAAPLRSIRYVEAQGFNTSSTANRARRMWQTLYDYLHESWNDTASARSPGRYFGGVLRSCGYDNCGDVVYEFVERTNGA